MSSACQMTVRFLPSVTSMTKLALARAVIMQKLKRILPSFFFLFYPTKVLFLFYPTKVQKAQLHDLASSFCAEHV